MSLSDSSARNCDALQRIGEALANLVDDSEQPIYSVRQVERIIDRLDRTPGAQHVAFWNPVLERWVAVSEGSEPSFREVISELLKPICICAISQRDVEDLGSPVPPHYVRNLAWETWADPECELCHGNGKVGGESFIEATK